MDASKNGRCPSCSAALWAEPKTTVGRRSCPRCDADLFFVNVELETHFIVRGSNNPVAQLLENSDLKMDSLDVVELVMELEEENRWNQ